jgi:predicted metal-dependent phosphoesterase TrpH
MRVKDFRADLHCHTTCSDGTATPTEIVELAIKAGLQGLSITDHDTIEAYKEIFPLAQEKSLEIIPGVEFSASLNQKNVHILAYAFSLKSPIISDFCKRHHERRLKRNQLILDQLTSQGMPLTLEEVYPEALNSQKSLGRPHIALAMVKKGYTPTIERAFQEYIGEGKSCYVSGQSFSVEETIEIIHQANGLAVIAHPHLIENIQTVKTLLDLNFDGIEGYYGRFPRGKEERWIKIGNHRKWIVTGGSDFHGTIKPNLPLGCSWVNQETFLILQNHYKNNL